MLTAEKPLSKESAGEPGCSQGSACAKTLPGHSSTPEQARRGPGRGCVWPSNAAVGTDRPGRAAKAQLSTSSDCSQSHNDAALSWSGEVGEGASYKRQHLAPKSHPGADTLSLALLIFTCHVSLGKLFFCRLEGELPGGSCWPVAGWPGRLLALERGLALGLT